MPKCSVCGKTIQIEEDTVNIGERNQVFHISCSPSDLLKDAVTEGNAVLARGITYYVNKYLPNEIRAPSWPLRSRRVPTDEELIVYAELFAKMLRTYRNEIARRKKH